MNFYQSRWILSFTNIVLFKLLEKIKKNNLVHHHLITTSTLQYQELKQNHLSCKKIMLVSKCVCFNYITRLLLSQKKNKISEKMRKLKWNEKKLQKKKEKLSLFSNDSEIHETERSSFDWWSKSFPFKLFPMILHILSLVINGCWMKGCKRPWNSFLPNQIKDPQSKFILDGQCLSQG